MILADFHQNLQNPTFATSAPPTTTLRPSLKQRAHISYETCTFVLIDCHVKAGCRRTICYLV